jgi:sulfatase maturation enzyme AslB (radical SAM superfamily)
MMSLAEIVPYLEEGAGLGVKEYYFTGGEPFLNREMEEILEKTLEFGPATVLTNGLLLDPGRCDRLWQIAETSSYSLDFRVSMDGYDAESNDPIRGSGTFVRILEGISTLAKAGLNPVITVTEVHDDNVRSASSSSCVSSVLRNPVSRFFRSFRSVPKPIEAVPTRVGSDYEKWMLPKRAGAIYSAARVEW